MTSHIIGELVEDKHKGWSWKTREGELIPVHEMQDSHLRNTALFLMGLGYQKCNIDDRIKVAWLNVFRMEWERRMAQRRQTSIRIAHSRSVFTDTIIKSLTEAGEA